MPFTLKDIEPYGKPTLPVKLSEGDKPDLVSTIVSFQNALWSGSLPDIFPYLTENFRGSYRGGAGPDDPVQLKRGMDFHWKICKGGRLLEVSQINPVNDNQGRLGVKVKAEQLVDGWLEVNMVYWFEKSPDGKWRITNQDCWDCGYPDHIIQQMMRGDF